MNEQRNNKSNTIVYLFQALLFIGLVLSLHACNDNNEQASGEAKVNDSLVKIHVTSLSDLSEKNKPLVTLLDTVPKPQKTAIPQQTVLKISDGKTASSTTAKLSPPLTHLFVDPVSRLPIAADAQGKGLFTTYTTDDGLALDQVYCSYKDKRGNIWFGTNGGGISKFDGNSFTNYTTIQGLAHNVVWSITEDNGGNIWIGTDGSGVSRYDGKVFTNYTTAQGLANDIVYSIKQDRLGNLWFGTNGGGVSKYDGKSFTSYTIAQGLTNNTVRAIMEDRKGNMWFGTLGGGVSKFNGKNMTTYATAAGLANDSIKSIMEDQKGNLWFGTDGGGVSKYDGVSFINYNLSHDLPNSTVWSMTEDKAGNLWFGTNGGGVSKYDGKSFTNYTTSQGLVSNTVRCITEDETGNLWFGTFGGGVSKYEGESFMNFTRLQGLPGNVVYSITEDIQGYLWFGIFGGGLCKYDGKSFTNYTTLQGLPTNAIYCTAKDSKGNLWLGSFGSGVIKFDGKTFTNYTKAQGLADNVVFCITEDNRGNLWFGTSGGGVSKFDGESFTTYTTAQGLVNNEVFSITADRYDNLWFSTSGGGVSKYDGKSFMNFTTGQGLISDMIWTITEDKTGNLWFGTQEGLSMMRNETLKRICGNIKRDTTIPGPLFASFTTKDGLPDNFVTQVIQANDQRLYIGTNRGVCEMIPETIANSGQIKWQFGAAYNSITGYPVKDVNAGQGAMCKDSKGIIWIGTGSDKTGLVRFNPQALVKPGNKPPLLVIRSIKINEEKIAWNDLHSNKADKTIHSKLDPQNIVEEVSTFGRPLSIDERVLMQKKFGAISFDSIVPWYPVPQNLVLPHNHNSITFDFNAIEPGKNYLVKYQYMLEGYDKYWSPPGSKSSATFGNIYEGKYTFKIKAKSPEGVWSQPVAYTFKVLPPWWRTWWMIVLYALIIIITIVFIFRWNTKRIIDQKNILKNKVNAATREIRDEKEKVEHQKKKVEETLKELESAQALLIQSEKMASLGELTAGIAHEIQNPLNFINNFSDINTELIDELQQELLAGKTQDLIDITNDIKLNESKINQHGKRAEAIVKGMLQHSHSSSGLKEPFNINKIADEFLRLSYHGLCAKNKNFNAQIITDFDANLGLIPVIPQDIGRVLLNLYNNAFYAVNERQKIEKNSYRPTVSASTKKIGNKVEIKVSDNGTGIPQEVAEKIFQPFFTTKPSGEGTGLGLSLSYDIIKAHGGEIKIETKENEGTDFIIHLPAN